MFFEGAYCWAMAPAVPTKLLLLAFSAQCAAGLHRKLSQAAKQPTARTQHRPHLLFMMADQLRWDANGYSGPPDRGRAFRTPSLDRLKAEGVEFRSAWSSTPTCTPARAALLTGRSPWGHGLLGAGAVAPSYALEFPELLRKAGYHTIAIGKNHYGWDPSTDAGVGHGFQETHLYDGLGQWSPGSPHSWDGEWDDYDRWFEEKVPGKDPQATLDGHNDDGWNSWRAKPYMYDEWLHPTAWVGRKALEFLTSYPNRTDGDIAPFMLKVSFHRPHSPYDPPQRFLDAVSTEDLEPIKLCRGVAPDVHDDTGHGERWCLRFRGAQGDPEGCGSNSETWCGELPGNETEYSRRAYVASVNFVDEWVGHIYDALVQRNLLERTFIIWTSDHGDGQGDMYHWRKGYPYEFSAHVPMLLRWPETWAADQQYASIVERGSAIQPPVVTELRDVFHTLIDAAGLGQDGSLVPVRGAGQEHAFSAGDGKSLLCLLRNPTGLADCDYPPNPGPWREWIDLEHAACYSQSNHWSALTDGRIKYIFQATYGDEQLFDLVNDPEETMEVSRLPQYQAELKKWRSRMVQQFEREGRGDGWVKGGELVQRSDSLVYSPHYPGLRTPQAGDHTIMASNGATAPGSCGTNDCWLAKGQNHLQLVDNQTLCLGVVVGSNMFLEVALCDVVPEQHFTTNASAEIPAPIMHVPSGRCVVASNVEGERPSLDYCHGHTNSTLWLFGNSGRVCAIRYGGFCLRAEAGSGPAG